MKLKVEWLRYSGDTERQVSCLTWCSKHFTIQTLLKDRDYVYKIMKLMKRLMDMARIPGAVLCTVTD